MGRSHSSEPLDRDELATLVDIADDALLAALSGVSSDPRPLDSLPPALRTRRGAFVTLTVDGQLNGCIGDVVGRQALGHAVARLALAAAFDDPRLPALRPDQYERLAIEVSVLSPLSPVIAADRAELSAGLRPGIDGVVIGAGHRTGLFLPDVWDQLPDIDDFLDHLWRKAGLPASTWPDTVLRFTTQRLRRSAADTGGPCSVRHNGGS
jgi:AmmeMemoRadiSam system protein A